MVDKAHTMIINILSHERVGTTNVPGFVLMYAIDHDFVEFVKLSHENRMICGGGMVKFAVIKIGRKSF